MSNLEREDQNTTDKMTEEKRNFKKYYIPKSYEIARKISEGVSDIEDMEVMHTNEANDVYRAKNPQGIILVNKKGWKYDKVEFFMNVSENKKRLEDKIGENI